MRHKQLSCINNLSFRDQESHMHHWIHFNVDNSYKVKILISSTFTNHIICNNPQFILRNHGISKTFIFVYITHKTQVRFSLTNLSRRNYQISSSYRELEHHRLIHLVHIMVLKHVINALNISYTCICQKCNAWTIFLINKFLEF